MREWLITALVLWKERYTHKSWARNTEEEVQLIELHAKF